MIAVASCWMDRVEQGLDVAALDAHLEALLDLEPAARQRRLDELERSAPELVPVLRKLLRVAAEVDTVELRGVGGSLQLVEDERPPPLIEGYSITGEIGRGGMAIVYSAQRDVHGSQQPVAIKLLRATLGDGVERERFLTEQRILARLQHPHIARLIEVGSVDARPYMVLEQISGVPIDQHWKPGIVPVATVLDAALAIASALHHAHMHFVVHRDVKPDNVLVDSDGRIKLIDFGIAKLLPASTLLGAVRTATGAVPLTLRYASPEQLLGHPVGVASDLYQLGLLLYHLLTAAWPYDEQPGELPLQRLSHDQVPVLPSRRVGDRKRQRLLHGDLDSMLLRCLAWNPQDRYPSVLAFREDLERHMQQRPVRARRHTRGYLLRCFVSRHRLGVALAAAALLLVGVTSVAAFGLAARTRDYAERTTRILDTVATMFASANPYASNPGAVTVAEVVDATSQRFLTADDADPMFHLLMLERLAELQRALEDYRTEGALIDRALALADAHAVEPKVLARLRVQSLESAFARGELDRIASDLARFRADLDREYSLRADYVQAKVLIEQQQLAEAETAFAALFARLDEIDDALFRHSVHNSYGILQRRLGNADAAVAAYRRSLDFLDPARLEHQEALLTVPANIAIAYGAAGRYGESDAEFRALLERAGNQLGEDHPQMAIIARNYTTLLMRTGRFRSAATLVQRYAAASARSDDQLAQVGYLQARAGTALATGDGDTATRAAIESMELALGIHGGASAALAGPLETLSWTLFEQGHADAAARVAAQLLPRDPAQAPRAATVLALAHALGADVNLAPADWANANGNACDQAERTALREFLIEGRAQQQGNVPAECSASRGARLAAMGWQWSTAALAPFTPEPFDSALARAARSGQRPQWPQPLEAEWARRVDAMLSKL